MKQFDERLQELQQKLSRRNQLESQRASLRKQLDELDLKVRMLRDAANREQYDVTELEGLSFASIWAKISGSYDEKLRQEKKEAFAAAAKYESAMKELEYITAEYHRLAELQSDLEKVDVEYQQVLKEKRETLAAAGDESAKKILEQEQRIAYLHVQKKELEEAYQAGCSAMDVANHIADSLNSASGWATWDLLGGGLIADIAKHSHMNAAQKEIQTLQNVLRRFRTELADVKIDDDLDFQMDGFTSFGDWFLDGLLFDWMAMDHISKSSVQIQNTQDQIRMALSKLQDLQSALDRELRDVQAQLDELVSRA